MANQLIFSISLCIFVYINLVQTADSCQTHADCAADFWKFCCGPQVLFLQYGESKDRSCTYSWCLNTYCSSDSDCGDPSLCCRSNECVKNGCSGCTEDSNCSSGYYCCTKTFPLNQTVCATNCINKPCNSNDDCGGYNECCRSGRCTKSGCNDKCSSNSECDLGKFCCMKKSSHLANTGCGKSCVGERCSSDNDCGGPNECCISNKCVTLGCSGCIKNSNCSSGQYCCKKKYWYEVNECSSDCIGKSCNTNDDCGGPGENCDTNYRCITRTEVQVATTSASSLPSWLIAVIVVSLVVLFVAAGIFVAIFWYFKKVRPRYATQMDRRTVALQNTDYQGEGTERSHQNTQIPGFINPLSCSVTENHSPQQSTQVSGFDIPSQYRGTENQSPQPNQQLPGFNLPFKSPYPNGSQDLSSNEQYRFSDNLNNHAYHTLESPSAPQVNQLHGVNNQQFYSQNILQQPGNNSLFNPPFNPQYQGNH